jgi:hypothetical protein
MSLYRNIVRPRRTQVRNRAVQANQCAPIRAFCAPHGPQTRLQRPPARKNFPAVNSAASAASCARKYARVARAVRKVGAATSDDTWQKSASHRHFCNARNFSRAVAPPKFFFVTYFVFAARVDAVQRRGRALTHKIKQSHCYFFPAVVIGWQCTSIRDCTASMSPSTQARRAAMAKKRKAKAKAKKTKRRKKK